METPSLKSISNVTLLDMYYDYRNQLKTFVDRMTQAKNNRDKTSEDFYFNKVSETTEIFFQIRTEILSRMMGMEID